VNKKYSVNDMFRVAIEVQQIKTDVSDADGKALELNSASSINCLDRDIDDTCG
jgi:hypothetical protein